MKGRIYKDYSTLCDCAQELKTKDCGNCEHFLYLEEGDSVCEIELEEGTVRELLTDDWERTEHYFYCQGRKWKG